MSSPQTRFRSPSRGEGAAADLEPRKQARGYLRTMAWISLPVVVVLAGVHVQSLLNPAAGLVHAQMVPVLPAQAQVVDQRSFNGACL